MTNQTSEDLYVVYTTGSFYCLAYPQRVERSRIAFVPAGGSVHRPAFGERRYGLPGAVGWDVGLSTFIFVLPADSDVSSGKTWRIEPTFSKDFRVDIESVQSSDDSGPVVTAHVPGRYPTMLETTIDPDLDIQIAFRRFFEHHAPAALGLETTPGGGEGGP